MHCSRGQFTNSARSSFSSFPWLFWSCSTSGWAWDCSGRPRTLLAVCPPLEVITESRRCRIIVIRPIFTCRPRRRWRRLFRLPAVVVVTAVLIPRAAWAITNPPANAAPSPGQRPRWLTLQEQRPPVSGIWPASEPESSACWLPSSSRFSSVGRLSTLKDSATSTLTNRPSSEPSTSISTTSAASSTTSRPRLTPSCTIWCRCAIARPSKGPCARATFTRFLRPRPPASTRPRRRPTRPTLPPSTPPAAAAERTNAAPRWSLSEVIKSKELRSNLQVQLFLLVPEIESEMKINVVNRADSLDRRGAAKAGSSLGDGCSASSCSSWYGPRRTPKRRNSDGSICPWESLIRLEAALRLALLISHFLSLSLSLTLSQEDDAISTRRRMLLCLQLDSRTNNN